MLKRVVEDDRTNTAGDRFANAAPAIGSGDYRNARVEALMNDRLIASVAAQHDSRRHASVE